MKICKNCSHFYHRTYNFGSLTKTENNEYMCLAKNEMLLETEETIKCSQYKLRMGSRKEYMED